MGLEVLAQNRSDRLYYVLKKYEYQYLSMLPLRLSCVFACFVLWP